ncbi:DNA helicase [Mycobacterium phage Phrappuccino]|uniref:DNA helicase n=1 Tax=Mycobacterium phage Phrappuccino TaxID=2591223 RepID=A0A514DDU1_9CAUD|nr:DNA helicase [Mycobacterium phage Phrappuccino]QDH91770.1 DNA helicase [Mycobacterium phage Phrappuccino]QIQ63212.1 DNA helicase [Mycobacterium phage Settecandela]
MYPVLRNLEQDLGHLVDTDPNILGRLVVVEQSPDWPDQLVFQPMQHEQMFFERYEEWLSRYLILNEQFMLRYFVAQLEEDGYVPLFAPSCEKLLADYERWMAPLHIEGLTLLRGDGSPSELFDYQRFTINRALERAVNPGSNAERKMFFGWGAGAGKSAACSSGALELFNRGIVDLAFVFTLRKLKYNMRDFFLRATPLNAVVNDGTAMQRRKRLADPSIQVFVNNPDKMLWDYDAIVERIGGRRTLFVFDEAQVILTDGGQTKVRKAIEKVMDTCEAVVWPMSASVVNHSPFRYRDTYQLGLGQRRTGNPLGTKKEFEDRYVSKKRTMTFKAKNGGRFDVTHYSWDHDRLQEVRHRVAHCTQNARKTDPGVRENFKGLDVLVERVQMSDEDRRLYDALMDLVDEAKAREEPCAQHLQIARYICNGPAALAITENEIGRQLAAEYPELITNANSSKVEMFCDKVQSIWEAGDKAIAFTKWTTMTLHLLTAELKRRKIPFVEHYGVGMTDKQGYEAQVKFAEDPNIPLFLSSDAGAYGLNMQMCRYVINYECPFTYDQVMQRNARIDRADSHLDGLTSYIYVTDGTVEDRIYRGMMSDRKLVEATTGAREVLSYGEHEEAAEKKVDAYNLLRGPA